MSINPTPVAVKVSWTLTDNYDRYEALVNLLFGAEDTTTPACEAGAVEHINPAGNQGVVSDAIVP